MKRFLTAIAVTAGVVCAGLIGPGSALAWNRIPFNINVVCGGFHGYAVQNEGTQIQLVGTLSNTCGGGETWVELQWRELPIVLLPGVFHIARDGVAGPHKTVRSFPDHRLWLSGALFVKVTVCHGHHGDNTPICRTAGS